MSIAAPITTVDESDDESIFDLVELHSAAASAIVRHDGMRPASAGPPSRSRPTSAMARPPRPASARPALANGNAAADAVSVLKIGVVNAWDAVSEASDDEQASEQLDTPQVKQKCAAVFFGCLSLVASQNPSDFSAAIAIFLVAKIRKFCNVAIRTQNGH